MKIKFLITLIFAFSFTQNYGSDASDNAEKKTQHEEHNAVILNKKWFDIMNCIETMKKSVNTDPDTFKTCLKQLPLWIRDTDTNDLLKDWLTPVNYYIVAGDLEQLKKYLSTPIIPYLGDSNLKWTPLIWATAFNNLEMIRLIIHIFSFCVDMEDALKVAKFLQHKEASELLEFYQQYALNNKV